MMIGEHPNKKKNCISFKDSVESEEEFYDEEWLTHLKIEVILQ